MNDKINKKNIFFNKINEFKIDSSPLGEIALTYFDYLFQGRKKHVANFNTIKTFIWILSKLRFKNSISEISGSIVLIPMDNSNKRSLELYEPIQKNLEVNTFSTISVKDWLKTISFKSFFAWIVNIPKINSELNKPLKYLVEKKILYPEDCFALKVLVLKNLLVLKNTVSILKKSKVKSILVDWDHDNYQSLIVLAAKVAKIKTYTLIHGNICDRSFPIIADKCICWGPKQYDYFVENGTNKNRLVIGGNPRFKNYKNCISGLKEKLKIGNEKILLHFSQNFPEPNFDEFEFIKIIEDGVKNCSQDWKLVVKTHPVQNVNLFKEKVNPETILLDSSIDLKDSLSIADLSIIVNSTTIIDSILCGVPVTIFHPDAKPEDFQKDLVDYSNSPLTSTSLNITQLLNSINSDNIKDIMNFKAQVDFINHYCSLKDIQAGEKIAQILIEK